MPSRARDELVGVFVGGSASRMGGRPKGLLPAPGTGEPIIVRLTRIVEALGFEPVLVGKAAEYAQVLPTLGSVVDEPAGIGPLGGLSGLLAMADQRPVIALACDMPRISSVLLARLATAAPHAMVLAPRNGEGLWEPLCARYDPVQVRPLLSAALARGVRSFQALFESLDVAELALSVREREELIDWDSPSDMGR